jgi:hypothetical protein
MDACLNLLGQPVVFIPIAALLALILLVWAQLHMRGGGKRSVNWTCGVTWAFLALLSALIAVAIFVPSNTSDCAKGFLMLAFFMAVVNVVIIVVLEIADLFWDLSSRPNHSLLAESAGNQCWAFVWLALLFGLGFISFSVANELTCLLWNLLFWIGVVLVFLVFLNVFIVVLCINCKSFKKCRLCKRIRKHWRKKRKRTGRR